MSAITLSHASPSLSDRLHALVSRVFAGRSAQGRLYGGLKDLPDHLLLDIGVDPRKVPPRGGETEAGTALDFKVAAALFRSAAKS